MGRKHIAGAKSPHWFIGADAGTEVPAYQMALSGALSGYGGVVDGAVAAQ